jgi:hypothetical protein
MGRGSYVPTIRRRGILALSLTARRDNPFALPLRLYGDAWTRDEVKPMSSLLLAALLLTAPVAEPDPTKIPKPPEVKFEGLSASGAMLFSVSNPNATPLPYFGYRANSFNPPLQDGTIAPLYTVEVGTAGVRKSVEPGWCVFGVGAVSIPAKGKVTFKASVPDGEWDEVKAGLRWYPSLEQKGPTVTAWSGAIRKELLAQRKAKGTSPWVMADHSC